MHRHHKYMEKMRSRPRIPSIPIASPDDLDLGEDVAHQLLVRAEMLSSQLASPPQLLATSTTKIIYATQTAATPNASIPQASEPAVIALANKGQSASYTEASPTAGSYIQGTKRPLSETTRHLLLIAGSVGITIALIFIGFLFWRRRRRNKKDMLDKSKIVIDKEPSVSAPLGSNWGTYKRDAESTYAVAITYKETVDTPEQAYLRPGTSQSNRAMPTKAPFAPPNKLRKPNPLPVFVPAEPSLPTQRPQKMEPISLSPVLPVQRPDTRPSSPSQVSSVPPYLAHMYGSPTPNTYSPPKVSRFSWTNSQGPKTPMNPNQYADVNRYSGVSEAESVARYRTVESWVGQQAGRYEEARIQERIRMQLDEAINEVSQAASSRAGSASNLRSRDSSAKPQAAAGELKTIPLKDSSSVYVDGVEDEEEEEGQVTDLSLVPEAARTASVKRRASRKAKHNTSESDMTVFRAHPGTKVEIPGRRYIPSVTLDGKLPPPGTYQRRDSYGY